MITDDTRKVRLAGHAHPVRGLLQQGLGLMFRRPLEDVGWVFLLPWKGDWDVTNLFVFFPIDVLWLDAERRVLHKKRLAPFAWRAPGAAGTRYLIELPAGAADPVDVGNTVSWRFPEEKRI